MVNWGIREFLVFGSLHSIVRAEPFPPGSETVLIVYLISLFGISLSPGSTFGQFYVFLVSRSFPSLSLSITAPTTFRAGVTRVNFRMPQLSRPNGLHLCNTAVLFQLLVPPCRHTTVVPGRCGREGRSSLFIN